MKTLFHAGHIQPRTQPDCTDSHHIGPRVESEILQRAGGVWAELAHCGACGSTVARWKIADLIEEGL